MVEQQRLLQIRGKLDSMVTMKARLQDERAKDITQKLRRRQNE